MFLSGIRVLEWAQGLSAPFAARVLADLGADVIKVEDPDGDPLRAGSPAAAALFAYVNAGKRGVSFDPGSAAGRRAFNRLLAPSDVLIEAQPSERRKRLAYSVDAMRDAQPALVVVSHTAFAHEGSLGGLHGSEMTLQHHAGFAWHQARPVHEPAKKPPVAGADREAPLLVGLGLAVAAIWGLLAAERNGAAPRVTMSSFDFHAHLLFEALAEWGNGERGFRRERAGFRGAEVAGGLIWILPCTDGWVMASPREQHQWERWIELLGKPAWAGDATLCGDRDTRKRQWAPLQELMSEWTRTRTRQEVFELAQAAKVPCFPVSRPSDILENDQLAHRRFFDTLRLASGKEVSAPGLPFIALGSTGRELSRARTLAAPALGEAGAQQLGPVL